MTVNCGRCRYPLKDCFPHQADIRLTSSRSQFSNRINCRSVYVRYRVKTSTPLAAGSLVTGYNHLGSSTSPSRIRTVSQAGMAPTEPKQNQFRDQHSLYKFVPDRTWPFWLAVTISIAPLDPQWLKTLLPQRPTSVHCPLRQKQS